MARYPALSRLRQDRVSRESSRSEPASAAGFLSGITRKVRHEWEWRSARFLAGFVIFICSILLFVASIGFLLSALYSGIHWLTGSQIASFTLMCVISLLSGIYFMAMALRKIGESVDFDSREAPEIID